MPHERFHPRRQQRTPPRPGALRRPRTHPATLLTGCGSTSSTTEGAKSSSSKKTVLTTFTVLADIARNVAGDDLNVESLTKPGAEIHEYEPPPPT